MNIVFDTNVLLSALITQGLSFRVLDICIDKHRLFISDFILNETIEKLSSKFHVPSKDIRRLKDFITNVFIRFIPEGDMPDVCRDPDDNNILHLAECVKADFIITGDKDLLSLKKHGPTEIITPRDFMEKIYKPR